MTCYLGNGMEQELNIFTYSKIKKLSNAELDELERMLYDDDDSNDELSESEKILQRLSEQMGE